MCSPTTDSIFLEINIKKLPFDCLRKKKNTNILPWSKSFRNLFIKSKIQIYSSKSMLSLSKFSWSTATLDPILETFFMFGFRFGHQGRLRFFHYLLFWLLKRVPTPEWFFESTEQEKVAGRQISRIRWLCWMVFDPFLVKKLRITIALCDQVLRDSHKSGLFWRIASHKRLKMSWTDS